ncbi:hypothetical protein QYM36_000839 [Artemia franciscana]|uniref:Uncharacterized protein n=1 Tax=Artemia franciscana TaxID=6661 RepID=A0AA88LLI1_ARTSF|nr:hypothetical protein QYM36_000839 [Artemia franciscana]
MKIAWFELKMGEEKPEAGVTDEMFRNPSLLAALQSRLNSMVGQSSDYVQMLPEAIKRRIRALKNLQLEAIKEEAKFFNEVHELEVKYHQMYLPLYEKRQQIVNGVYEPSDAETHWALDEENEDLSEEVKAKAKIAEGEKKEEIFPEDVKGIPEFWLTIFKNVDCLASMVQEHDEPILRHLTDVTVDLTSNPMGFTLKFHFSPNEYFTDSVLTKFYDMNCSVNEKDPFEFEGPEITTCQGCTINWKPGKNVTVKTIKKKQKHKSRGSMRTITKTVTNDSFFNFFNPPTVRPGDEIDEDVQALATADYEIGHYIRERVVPRAVLYFTGK